MITLIPFRGFYTTFTLGPTCIGLFFYFYYFFLFSIFINI